MEYRVLGPVEVVDDGRVRVLGGYRQRLVLAVLLSRPNQVVGTDWLIDAVWGRAPPRTARKTLQVYLARLRQATASDAIETTPAGYRVVATADTLDTMRFETLAEQGRTLLPNEPDHAADLLRQALGLWRGAPYGELGDEPALQPEIARLVDTRVGVLEDRLEADLACGRGADLVPELTSLVERHPHRERLRAHLMLALYRAGRQTEALASFEQARRMLADDLGADPGDALTLLHEQILRHEQALDAPPSAHADDETLAVRNPYKGLRAFTASDADDFFGRSRLVDDLARAVADHPLVAVVGASGSGKSSAVAAGLVPRLRAESPPWVVVSTTPGHHPFQRVFEAARAVGAADAEPQGDRLDLLRTLQAVPADGSRVLLVVDQFEELVTHDVSDTERSRFVANLVEVVDEPVAGIAVLLVVRADFFHRVLDEPTLARLALDSLVGVVPMAPEEIEAAAADPAARVGVSLQPELVAEVVADLSNHPGALPLFEYALTEAFDARPGRALTLDGYRAVGGLHGALARRAEQTFQTLGADERLTARQVFLRLVSVGPGVEATRQQVRQDEVESLGLPGATTTAVLEAFDRARLLTFDRDTVHGSPTVELAHEALITGWPRFADWVRSVRDDLRLRQRLEPEVDEWLASGRNPEYLMTGSPLDAYVDWPAPGSLSPTAAERDFVAASRAEQARRVRQRRRAARRLRGLVAAMTALAVLASVMLVVSVQRGDRIEAAALADRARDLAAASVAAIGIDPDVSLILALEAQQLSDASSQPTGDPVTALHHSLAQNRVVAAYPDTADVAFLPDGSLVLAGDRTSVVDLDSGAEVLALDSASPAATMAASADGRWIALGTTEGALTVWDAADGSRVTGFAATEGSGSRIRPPVTDVAFDPGGRWVASLGAYDWGLDVWSVPTGDVAARRVTVDDGARIAFARTGTRAFVTVEDGVGALSVDGSWAQVLTGVTATDVTGHGTSGFATVGGDGTVRVWDSAGRPTETLPTESVELTAVATSGDDSRLVAASADGTVHVWDRPDGSPEPSVSFAAVGQRVGDLAVDTSGTLVAGITATGTAYVWDVTDARRGEIGSWAGGGPVAVSPDGQTLAVADTGGREITVRSLTGDDSVDTETVDGSAAGPHGSIRGLTYDASRVVSTVASTRGRGQVVLQEWEPGVGSSHVALDADASGFGRPAVSDDGATIAVAVCGGGPAARVVTSSGVVSVGDSACSRAVDLDGAGALLAVQSDEGRVTVWDVGSHRDAGWMTQPASRVMTVQHQPATAGSVAFSPDESRLLTAGADGSARVWEVPSGDLLLSLDTGGGPVEGAVWTPDGARIVTSSQDGVPRVWDARTGRLEAELPAYSMWPHLAVTPDSRWLLTSADGVVQAWMLDVEALVDLARTRVTRSLTAAECERYGLDPCPVTPAR